MKYKVVFLFVLVMISVAVFKTIETQKNSYNLKTFKVESGWGYSIYKKNKLFIKQETIPSIPSNKSFISRSDANKIGELMLKKLISKKMPSVSYKELQQNSVQL